MYSILLFDLDGTLLYPQTGIVNGVKYALEKMGIHEPHEENLERFQGPPIQVSFAQFYHLNEEDTWKAVGYFREYYKEKGMWENEINKGMEELLKRLKQQGKTLYVATSKPNYFAEPMLEKVGLDHLFTAIVGAEMDGTRSHKIDVITHILNLYPHEPKTSFVMIGDREHDVIGAQKAGIDSIALNFGHGSLEELEKAQPTHIAHSIEELEKLLL